MLALLLLLLLPVWLQVSAASASPSCRVSFLSLAAACAPCASSLCAFSPCNLTTGRQLMN
jgi:hypothetical protein